MYGGLGAFACGITSSDAAVILASGEIWFQVPSSVKINIAGMLGQCVTAKDIMLKMLTLALLEQFIYKAVEIEGAAIRKLSVSGRLVICNMVAEMGAKNAIIAADERTAEYLKVKPDEIVCDRSDPEERYEKCTR
jgi:3-isopropylmalate/(R)-2-methylmalate dehydratase large subunit